VTSLHRDTGAVWRAARTPVLIGLLLLLTGVLIGVLSGRTEPGFLDPTAADDTGSRALATLLRDEGTRVDIAGTAAEIRSAGPGTTVLVPFPARLAPRQLQAVRESAADIVVVAPGQEVVSALAPPVEVTTLSGPVEVRDPACDLPAAVLAGRVDLGGELYRGGVGCYPSEGGAALVQVTGAPADAPADAARGRTTTVLGSPDILVNSTLAEEGNAALALALLGENPRLLWFLPILEGPAVGEERSLTELVPPGWPWGAAQLAVAALLLIVWRARRLGPVVTEPLPVVVRSAEAVEGRARLYRRTGAAAHAAEVLRGATRARLAPVLGLPDTAGPDPVVAGVAARTGRPAAGVHALLYGRAPVDDAALIALADALDACETEVRRS